MLYELELEVLVGFLGNQRVGGDITSPRKFRKTSEGLIALDMGQWNWAYEAAIRALKLDHISLECVRPARGWAAGRPVLYRRHWKRGAVDVSETFECIPEKATIKISVYVAPQSLDKKAGPSLAEFISMTGFVGEYLGLSPWGSKFGYGRFRVLKCKEQ